MKLTTEVKNAILQARLSGLSYAEIAQTLGISRQRVHHIDKYNGGAGRIQAKLEWQLLPGTSILVHSSQIIRVRNTLYDTDWDYKTRRSKIPEYFMVSRYY